MPDVFLRDVGRLQVRRARDEAPDVHLLRTVVVMRDQHGRDLDVAAACRATDARRRLHDHLHARRVRESGGELVKRLERIGKKEALFETGYGPSGLPHIGTFGEVARTTMVRTAFRLLTRDQIPTRLICFSDDLDGMRKIPDNVPSREAMEPHLQKPLTAVPDPWTNEFDSFGAHNNAMLRRFLDTFGFDYEFASATDYYKSGRFDAVLLRAAERYDDIMAVMLPTLGAERQATYSPILPISPTTDRVLYVPMKEINAAYSELKRRNRR